MPAHVRALLRASQQAISIRADPERPKGLRDRIRRIVPGGVGAVQIENRRIGTVCQLRAGITRRVHAREHVELNDIRRDNRAAGQRWKILNLERTRVGAELIRGPPVDVDGLEVILNPCSSREEGQRGVGRDSLDREPAGEGRADLVPRGPVHPEPRVDQDRIGSRHGDTVRVKLARIEGAPSPGRGIEQAVNHSGLVERGHKVWVRVRDRQPSIHRFVEPVMPVDPLPVPAKP